MTTERPRVGVVGLGIMGGAMSANLLAAGFEVYGYDTDDERQSSFSGVGLPSAAEVANLSDVVLLSLPSGEALSEVVEQIVAEGERRNSSGDADERGGSDNGAAAGAAAGANRTAAGAAAGANRTAAGEAAGQGIADRATTRSVVVVEMGTLPLEIKQQSQKRLAAVGVDMLDAPVSGTGLQAADATLIVYASGSRPAYESARAVFEVIAARSFYLGEFGNGSRMKFVANLLVAVNTVAAAEAHALGAAAGLAPSVTQEVIAAGVGSSRMFEIRGAMMVEGSYDPAARLAIIKKDAEIIAEFARTLGVGTPLLDAALPLYRRGTASGLGDLDAAAVRRLFDLGPSGGAGDPQEAAPRNAKRPPEQ